MKIKKKTLCVFNYHLFGFNREEQTTAVDSHSTGEVEG